MVRIDQFSALFVALAAIGISEDPAGIGDIGQGAPVRGPDLPIALASLTYLVVERPLRFNAYRKTTTVALLTVMILLGSAGYFVYRHGGLAFRAAMNPEIHNEGDIDHLFYHEYSQSHFFPCTPESIRKDAALFGDVVRCLQSKKDQPIDVAIIGDSHAEQLFLGLAEALPNLNVTYYFVGQNDCPDPKRSGVLSDFSICIIGPKYKNRDYLGVLVSQGLHGSKGAATLERSCRTPSKNFWCGP